MANEAPRYNPIFSRFVPEDASESDQLRGLIAYGFYKIAKREWVIQRTAQSGQPPTPQELDAYTGTWTESRLKGLEQQATGTLLQYAESIVDSATPSIREEALRGTTAKSIMLSITANFVYTALLILLLILLRFAGVDLLSILTPVGAGK